MTVVKRFLLLFYLFTGMACADPVISEFMASNLNSIVDENGDHSDWIEIRNTDALPVTLTGWSITDTAANLQKWVFPAVTIPAKGQIVVFASGKDRRVVGQNLHTNFSLAAGGEYLALVKPDGVTKTAEFAPTFPPQTADISYGTTSTSADVTLINKASAVSGFVPVNNTLGTSWRARIFSEAGWLSGTFAAGFMNYNAVSNPNLQADLGLDFIALGTGIGGTGRSAYLRAHFTIANPALVTKLTVRANYDDGFFAWVNAAPAAFSPNAPAEAALAFNTTVSGHNPITAGTFDTFDASTQIGQLVAGDNVLAIQVINSGSGSSDLFMWPELTASIDTGLPGVTGYFNVATPGAVNGGAETIQLPQTVTFSRASGPFTAAFDLFLGGAIAGQEIRYVISDPNASPGANAPEPTAASSLYSGAINIPSNKLIRAAVFNSANGQKGRTSTALYQLLETAAGGNNTSNFTSTLPIVVADDHGAGQPVDSSGEDYTTAMFELFDLAGPTASLNSTPTVFSRAGMRVRGSSSSGFPKLSYGLELRDEKNVDGNLALLGLASDADWILNGPWLYDDTFIHNAFIDEVSRQCGRWAPRTRLVEMFMNEAGGKLDYSDYAGIYVLTEKIKSGSQRLNITSIGPEDATGEALTGGYIFKIDRADDDEVNWITTNDVPDMESGQRLVIVEPDPQTDTAAQISYLQGCVQTFDTTLFAERAAGFNTRNYRNSIDVGSWIDHHILNTLAYNADGLRLSSYFSKDRNGKIKAGPIWDFDRALGSDDGRDADPRSWSNIEYYFTRDWWGQLFQDPDFVQAWVDRWWELRAGPLADSNLNTLADQMGAQIGNTVGARDAAKWPDNAAAGGVFLNEISAMKTWLTSTIPGALGRTNWIDSQLPAAPTASVASGVVNAGTGVTLSGAGTMRYATNGTDPRPAGGGTSSTASTGTSITIAQTTVVTARRQGSFAPFPSAATVGWSAPVTRVYLVNEAFAVAGDIAVSEINYNPLGPIAAESSAVPGVVADDFEFVELKNIGARKVNLFEVKFVEGAPFKELKLAPLSLNPGDFAFVVKNRAAFTARYGPAMSAKIAGEWGDGNLSDGGEPIQILARGGSPIQSFTYSDGGDWPGRADGKGSTLEYIGAAFANADFNNPLNWRSSTEIHGTPGTAGGGPDQRIVINEILAHSNLPRVDAIELFNTSAASVDVSGWYLSDEKGAETAGSYKQFRIPNGTVIPAGAYRVFTEVDFNPNGLWNPTPGTPGTGEFAFDSHHGDEAWLIQADAGGVPLKFIDHAEFGATPSDESLGRWPNGTGGFYPMLTRTLFNEASATTPRPGLGTANSAPRIGPLLISEIHHSPASANTNLEFIEIRNPGATAQSLAHWTLRGAVDFDFALTDSLPAGALVVIVPFGLADTAKVNAFRATHGISASVMLLGPWSTGDHLASADHSVLYRADDAPPTEPGYYPQLIEDEAHYASSAPWPVAIGGPSLHRRGTAGLGDLGLSWKADVPSPGTVGPTYAQWSSYYFPAAGPGSAAGDDADNDLASNALEYSRGTVPIAPENQLALAPALARTGPGSGSSYVFTFTKPLDRPGTQYRVQQSANLTAWTYAADVLVSTFLETETRTVTIPIDGGTPPRLFLRLEAVITP